MKWIAGIQKNEQGKLIVLAQDKDGAYIEQSISSLTNNLDLPGTTRNEHLWFQDARLGHTTEYLEGIGMPHLNAMAQKTYELKGQGATYVIPTQLLAIALFGANEKAREQLLLPLSNNETVGLGSSVDEWINNYPSARSSYSSVYEEALFGNFQILLPNASFDADITAVKIKRKYYVTRLDVLSVIPREKPLANTSKNIPSTFYLCDPQKIISLRKEYLGIVGDSRLKGINKLTDTTWSKVAPYVKQALSPKREMKIAIEKSHRINLDYVIEKLGENKPWINLPTDKNQIVNAMHMLSRLKKANVWDKVVEKVLENQPNES